MGDTTTQHKEISIHTPTQGVTLYGYVFSKKYNDFNPHSHAGSDNSDVTSAIDRQTISIHTPTQGVTDFESVSDFDPSFQSTLPRRE